MTSLRGTLYRDGEVLCGADAFFDLRALPKLLGSLRLVAAPRDPRLAAAPAP